MKKKFTSNLGLKILALLFSVVIWFIVVNINDPVDKSVFRNVPVEILNADAITGEGKVYEILNETNVIDVTVRAKRSILDTISKENIIATADMQEMNFMDTMVRIKLSTNKYNDRLESIRSSTENLLVNIEDLKQMQYVVETAATGEPAEGYILGAVSSDQNLVRLSGPESAIEKVERVAAVVDVSGLSQDVRTDATLRMYDADSNLIDDKSIKKSIDQVKINVEILQTRRLPLSFKVSGEPATGYALTGLIESNPASVLVAGKSNVIQSLSQIEIPDTALNVSGQSGDMKAQLDLRKYLPDGVSLVDNSSNGNVEVTVYIEREESGEIIIGSDDISLQGLPDGLEGELQELGDEIEVAVKGLAENMEALEENPTITGVVDVAAYMREQGLEELQEGTYEMEVALNLPEGVEVISPLRARLTVVSEGTGEADTGNDE